MGHHLTRDAAQAERALGLDARDRHDLTAARRHLRNAIRIARSADLPEDEGEARLTLVSVLALAGHRSEAVAECDRAETLLRGVAKARLDVQRGTLLDYLGDADGAIGAYTRALPVLRRHGEHLWLARLHNNRGLLHLLRYELGPARDDLHRAESLLVSLGDGRSLADVRHNLGLLAARMGDVPLALDWFARASDAAGGDAELDAFDLRDRSEALLRAGLVEEAIEAATAAVEQLRAGGASVALADACLVLAEAALAAGDAGRAEPNAQLAFETYRAVRHRAGVALAREAAVRAAWLRGERTPALLDAARTASRDLAANHHAAPALRMRVLTGELAIELGRRRIASRQLGAAARARRRGPAHERATGWHAEALLRLEADDRSGARSAVRAGLDVLEAHRSTLAATDLRASAARAGTALAGLGVRIAFDDGDAARVLASSERGRAASLHASTVRPPRDPDVAAALAELRSVVAEADLASRRGEDTSALRRRQAALEVAVRDRVRRERAPGGTRARKTERGSERPLVRRLLDALDGRALVELVDVGGDLAAVTVAAGRTQLTPLGACARAAAELDALRFSLRRLAMRLGSPRSLEAAAEGVAHAAAELDALLLGPVASLLEDRELVLVPTAALHALPWALLPSCAGRPVTVVPSAALWLRAVRADRAPGVVLAAGPDLPGAAAEVATLARHYPGATRLTGSRATAAAVAAALDGAALGHVAAHGRFRADNAMFSCLLLADGPLTVYDLEALRRAPTALVLSSCESGVSSVQPGDELMGLAASLLALGTSTLVASVSPVPDVATTPIMVDLHRRLRAGDSPSAAVAGAQARAATEDPPAATFVCFGAG